MPPIWDTDIWWHLRVGEWIVQNKSFPKLDMFSAVHPDRPWSTFNWLFEVLLYGLHQTVGLFGIRVFFSVLVLTGFQIWTVYFWQLTQSRKITSFLLLTLLFLYADRLRIRPHLVNFVFEGSTLLFLVHGGALYRWRDRFAFFVAAVLWSNFHNPCAAMVAGVVVGNSVFQIVRSSKSSKNYKVEAHIAPAVLAIVAIFCNPYGPSLLFAGVKNIAPVYQAVGEGEWIPPLHYIFTKPKLFQFVVCLIPLFSAIGAIVLIAKKIIFRNGRPPSKDDFMSSSPGPLLFLAISQTAMRFVYLCVPSIAWMLKELHWQNKKCRVVLMATAVLFLSLLYHHQVIEQGGLKKVMSNISVDVMPDQNPKAATDVIRNANLSGKVFTPLSWGGYILWFAHPVGGVSADGRSNTTLEVLYLQNLVMKSLGRSSSNIISVLDQLHFDIAVLPKDAFPFSHWPTKEWIRVAYDQVAEVFIRVGSEDMNRIQKWLNVKSNDPLIIQQSATLFFGEEYYRSMKSELQKLPTSVRDESIHDRIHIEEMASHDQASIQLLMEHLKEVPNCIQAATELAEILHNQGKYDAARQLLSPLQGFDTLPRPTRELMEHLRREHP